MEIIECPFCHSMDVQMNPTKEWRDYCDESTAKCGRCHSIIKESDCNFCTNCGAQICEDDDCVEVNDEIFCCDECALEFF